MNYPEEKSELCFPKTLAVQAYIAIQETRDLVHRNASKILTKFNLSVPQYGVILHLYDCGPLDLSTLSSLIFRGNSNITNLIDRMVRDGLVKREENHQDRRFKSISLTSKGEELAPKIISEFRSYIHIYLSQYLNSEEQKAMTDLLRKIEFKKETVNILKVKK